FPVIGSVLHRGRTKLSELSGKPGPSHSALVVRTHGVSKIQDGEPGDLGKLTVFGAKLVLLLSLGLMLPAAHLIVWRVGELRIERQKKAEDDRKAEERRQVDAEKARQNEEQERQEMQRLATSWGLPLDAVLRGKKAADIAAVHCKSEAKKLARFEADSSFWASDLSSWRMDSANLVIVTGNNLKMKNGFGVSRSVEYRCGYDLNTRDTVVLSVQ
ncbi:hypothetical protein MCW82_22045, partial [Azospirillum doebereinerae]|uniref:hypothetical protein n=1 Tax=Azospirillum doebereinerae TaxID=92933 RepID=UPI001EE5E426